MNAAYFLTRFEEFERENVWDELFHVSFFYINKPIDIEILNKFIYWN